MSEDLEVCFWQTSCFNIKSTIVVSHGFLNGASHHLQGSPSGIEFGGEHEDADNPESTRMVHSNTAGTMATGASQPLTDGDFEADEEEPKLRYQRLGASLTELLKYDSARCAARFCV
jgi:hypothetical protein